MKRLIPLALILWAVSSPLRAHELSPPAAAPEPSAPSPATKESGDTGQKGQKSVKGQKSEKGQKSKKDETATLTITVRDCRRLLTHVAHSTVKYKSGVDVRGNKVAPADYEGDIQLKLPDSYEFDITVDIRRFMGGPAADALAQAAPTEPAFERAARIGSADAKVGTIRFNINSGRLTFNGQSLTREAETELAHKCREVMIRHRR